MIYPGGKPAPRTLALLSRLHSARSDIGDVRAAPRHAARPSFKPSLTTSLFSTPFVHIRYYIMDVGALSNLFKLEVIATSAVAYAVWTVLKGIYNVYLHPLAKFPGPKWATFSVWWKINLEVLQGKGEVDELFKLHEIYGENHKK